MKKQEFQSVSIAANLETIWALLQLEIEDPTRIDPRVKTLGPSNEAGEKGLRRLAREGLSWTEGVEVNAEALFVQHERRFEDGTVMTLIHQLSPSDESCDLNIASNWSETDSIPDWIDKLQPISERAKIIKQLAEALER